MQIQRVCEYYGTLVDKAIDRNIEACIPKLNQVDKDDTVYVMVDGSMVQTRIEKWKEVKLGRIFSERARVEISDKRTEILESVYVSHMGGVDKFFPKLERHLIPYNKKVIIGDGAKWIWNWVEDNYPGSIQILDFFHAKEKLVELSKILIKSPEKRIEWQSIQCEFLLDDQVEIVIKNIQKLKTEGEEGRELKEKTINYYLEHEDRMLYKTYRAKGLLIGSGPIEAAHRSILQTRMKLSGQKWSKEGANAIANLRCINNSNAWHILENIVKAAA